MVIADLFAAASYFSSQYSEEIKNFFGEPFAGTNNQIGGWHIFLSFLFWRKIYQAAQTETIDE